MTEKTKDYISLKFRTLKEQNLNSEKGKILLKEYFSLGNSGSCLGQKDSPRQKELICQMIDESNCEQILMDFDGTYVSKREAKTYVMNYS